MLKVMMALPELDVGGAQTLTISLIKALRKIDAEIQVQILVLEKPHGSYLEEQCRLEGIDVVYLGKDKGLHLGLIPKITKAIRVFAPDVIHMHKSRMHYFLLPILRSGVERRIYTVHNLAEQDTRNRWLQRLMSFAFHCCHVQPVAISDICRDSVAKLYHIEPDSIPCIYNGIDIGRFRNPGTRRQPEYGKMRFVSVGRLCIQKNYPLLLRTASRIHEQWPGTEFFILGDGEQRDSFTEQIAAHDAGGYIHLLGNVSDVPSHLWDADAFLMTSDYEGLPMTVLEAMAAGLPIISTKAGGIADVVQDGQNGFLVECGDEAGLVDAADKLCRSPELCRKYSAASIELSRKYSMERMAQQYLSLYTDKTEKRNKNADKNLSKN